jgi:hypothetical protein
MTRLLGIIDEVNPLLFVLVDDTVCVAHRSLIFRVFTHARIRPPSSLAFVVGTTTYISLMSQPVRARPWRSEPYQGTAVVLTIALLYFGGNFRNLIGPLEGSSTVDLDMLLGDFDATMSAYARSGAMEGIVCNHP